MALKRKNLSTLSDPPDLYVLMVYHRCVYFANLYNQQRSTEMPSRYSELPLLQRAYARQGRHPREPHTLATARRTGPLASQVENNQNDNE